MTPEGGVQAARGMLDGFESLPTEEQHGAIDHAIAELRNAKQALPGDY